MNSILVEITPPAFDVEVDIRYATDDNITGKPIYTRPACFLQKDAAEKMQTAIELAKAQGLRFKIFDAFRPTEAQQTLWDFNPDPEFLSEPGKGSCPHCRGVAVDLTLIDAAGKPLEMGTGFDDFTLKSHHGNGEVSLEAQKNRFLLMGIMTTAGWDFYRNEWWHYQLFEPRSYALLSDADAQTKMMTL
jgi:D-alanyl-D-alanine dipeptidase